MALYYNLPVYKASYKLVYMLFTSSSSFGVNINTQSDKN